jgi:hypothetical protein
VVLTIEDKPDRPVCAQHGPLRWGYFTDTKQGARWVSFVFVEDGRLEPHRCDNPDPAPVRWEPDPVVAERSRRGNELVRRVLAGDNPFTEETTNDR